MTEKRESAQMGDTFQQTQAGQTTNLKASCKQLEEDRRQK
jgi:hypothetical protein